MTGDGRGNTGSTVVSGNSVNSGNAGIFGELGGGWLIEDRGDLAFVSVEDPTGTPIRNKLLALTRKFGDRAWSATWWANLVLHDFVATGWRSTTDEVMDTESNNVNVAVTLAELHDLTVSVGERGFAIGEILSQDVEFTTDFMALLTITPGSHPNTYRVLQVASLIGSYAVLYYKGLYNRPRPSQLCPALLPPIPVPGHASWPSGHATQAWLKALLIEYVLDEVPISQLSGADRAVLSSNLRTLATRVARNREIAGLHYPTDSAAGRKLAATIAPFLTGMLTYPTGPKAGEKTWFRKAVDAAKVEWP
jgi:membrane-associated phospholipid phosphatase